MFMDTERENQIKLGQDWPYNTLNEGECLASSSFSETYKVKQGDTIIFNYTLANNMKNLHAYYNEVANEKGW